MVTIRLLHPFGNLAAPAVRSDHKWAHGFASPPHDGFAFVEDANSSVGGVDKKGTLYDRLRLRRGQASARFFYAIAWSGLGHFFEISESQFRQISFPPKEV